MAILSVFSGPFCDGDEVARALSEHTGYPRVEADIHREAAISSGMDETRLQQVIHAETGWRKPSARDRERAAAHLRHALASAIANDNVIIAGRLARLVPLSLPHALRVCLIANNEYRRRRLMEQLGVGDAQAAERIRREDESRARWTRLLEDRPPYDAEDYDLVLPMDELTPEEAAGRILLAASRLPGVAEVDRIRAIRDLCLAARVHVAVVEKAQELRVSARDGAITISVNRYTSRLDSLKRQLTEIARSVEGVKSVTVQPGVGFVPPSLMPSPDLPARLLLVDDEQEFVQSLSERLQSRHFDPAIVYDGEQALAHLETDPPEVMVLDLNMPGIDGIEVLRRVKQTHPRVEVIILTGHGSDREERLANDLGAFAYLKKPVNIDILAETLRQAHARAMDEAGGPDDEP